MLDIPPGIAGRSQSIYARWPPNSFTHYRRLKKRVKASTYSFERGAMDLAPWGAVHPQGTYEQFTRQEPVGPFGLVSAAVLISEWTVPGSMETQFLIPRLRRGDAHSPRH